MGFILHPKRTLFGTVLQLSAEEHVEFFKTSGMVFHPRLKAAFEELKLKVSSKGCTSLVALVGATGSGKSVALNRLAKYVLEAKDHEMNENPYIKPVIYVEAPPGSRGYYPWKELYRRIIDACDEGLNDPKIFRLEGCQEGITQNDINRAHLGSGDAEHSARVVKALLKMRQVDCLIIDEAQHISDAEVKTNDFSHNMQKLKSLTLSNDAVIVLSGTHRLLECGMISGEVGRRLEVVELRGYDLRTENNVKDFKNTFNNLLARFPIRYSEALHDRLEDIFWGCCGCVGILKDWMMKAREKALADGKDRVDENLFFKCRLPPRDLQSVAREIHHGKKYFKGTSMRDVKNAFLGIGMESQAFKKGKTPGRKPGRDPAGAGMRQSA